MGGLAKPLPEIRRVVRAACLVLKRADFAGTRNRSRFPLCGEAAPVSL